MKPLETTVEEVLQQAIQSEVETRVYYQKLAERAATPDVRQRMLQSRSICPPTSASST
jgi:rubrerythrin